MHLIQVDDEVFAELTERKNGSESTANEVLRQALEISSAPNGTSNGQTKQSLLGFVRGKAFQRPTSAVDRFLVLLGRLHAAHPTQFVEAAFGFRSRKRIYFAKSKREIVKSGESVGAKPVPHSPYWALTTLDNRSKRTVIQHLLQALGYLPTEIDQVLAELSQTVSSRRRGFSSTGVSRRAGDR